jgi:uncharacterized protein
VKTTPRPGARAVDLILRRPRKLPAPRNNYVIERGLRTPTRDGATLLGDLYSPAEDTVAWLRQQPWFNGNLATMGMSYVAFTQWALLTNPRRNCAPA